MGRKVKCKYCGTTIERDNAIKIEDKQVYVCKEHEILYRQELAYKQNQTKKFREITDYIQHIYIDVLELGNSEICWGRIVKELQWLINKGYKQEGILLSLKYAVEIEQIQWQKFYGIRWIVEECYPKEKQYYISTKRIEKMCECFDEDEEIIISTPLRSRTNSNLIDIDKL